jgi:hypothetical protein
LASGVKMMPGLIVLIRPPRLSQRTGHQSLRMSFWAASSASDSDAQSSGVTMLRTVSSPSTITERTFGTMAARQCPGFRW